MANSQYPDQTTSYNKMIASMCFNFMSKMLSIALLFFPSELWINLLQIELDRAKMLSFETSVECFEVFLFL